MVPSAPYRAKDFCIVKRDGWFHCFYIKRDASVPADSTERELGHAVSRDLYLWTQLSPVMQVRPNAWDNAKIWSPSIVEVDSVYYMFYTGVTVQPGTYAFYQQVGLATSTDLMTWNRLDEPVMACDRVRWTYCNPLAYDGGEFRDPFVMQDPATGGWLMYYTARPSSSPNIFVGGMAASSGDLTQWENREPLAITSAAWSGARSWSPCISSSAASRAPDIHGGGAGAQDRPGPVARPAVDYRGTLGASKSDQPVVCLSISRGIHDYLVFVATTRGFPRMPGRRLTTLRSRRGTASTHDRGRRGPGGGGSGSRPSHVNAACALGGVLLTGTEPGPARPGRRPRQHPDAQRATSGGLRFSDRAQPARLVVRHD